MLPRAFVLLAVFSVTQVHADFVDEESMPALYIADEQEIAQDAPAPAATPLQKSSKAVSQAADTSLSPFTGKVKSKRVRMRVQPDLNSSIVKELLKDDLVTVVGEHGEFWAVEPPTGLHAYIFRTFVLDNVVEGTRVNVRLQPDIAAPVIGHVGSGQKVDGKVCNANPKWLEITPPNSVRFYIAKDFLDKVGGPEVKVTYDRRRTSGKALLETAQQTAQSEMNRPYQEIDIQRVTANFKRVMEDYAEFADYAEQARDALTAAQEAFLKKRLAHVDHATAQKIVARPADTRSATDKMRMWLPIEEALYLSAVQSGEEKGMEQYYDEQLVGAEKKTGFVEAYTDAIRNRPGDFKLMGNDQLPIGYLYSTKVNLQELVGKQVTVIVSKRPQNNFAYPAYFVLGLE